MKTIPVTAAVIKSNGKILIARRKSSLCGNPGWEFPGGKVEHGETCEACLAREINEEFGVKIEVGNFIIKSEHKTNGKIIRLMAFDAKILSGMVTPSEHEEIAFVAPEALLNYNLLPADIPIAREIIRDRSESIYIHIPFCESKCSYCNFPSVAGENNLFQAYFNALQKEIIATAEIQNKLSGKINITSAFFGGGTPSSVPVKFLLKTLETLRENYSINDNAEISVECNPHSLTKKFADLILEAGVNRFSLGVQSLDDNELANLGRLHNSKKAETAYKLLRDAGAKNISTDFIYGIPGQTKDSFKNNLKRVVGKWNPEHISLYSLSVEPGTPFGKWKKNKTKNWLWPDDDTVMSWFIDAEKYLSANSYLRYEISNFAKQGFESIHNKTYWDTTKNYIGFGAAAHSYCYLTAGSERKRFRNIKSIRKYIERINTKQKFRIFSRELTHKQKVGEKIYLGLRLAAGVKLYSSEEKLFENEIQQQINLGLIKRKQNNKIVLTKRGFQIANSVMAEFV